MESLLIPQALGTFVTSSGQFNLVALKERLGLKAAEFATATGQRTESVAQYFKPGAKPVGLTNQRAKMVAGELVEIAVLLESSFGIDVAHATTWFHGPSSLLGGRTPLQVVQEGEGRSLIEMLVSVATGGSGLANASTETDDVAV